MVSVYFAKTQIGIIRGDGSMIFSLTISNAYALQGEEVKTIAVIDIDYEAHQIGVVQLAERKYPALLIQGDSLKVLYNSCQHLLEVLRGKACPDSPTAPCEDLLEDIGHYKQFYENALEANLIDLPYSKSENSI